MALLEKIEGLTLYTLAQQETLQTQRSLLEAQQTKMEALEARLLRYLAFLDSRVKATEKLIAKLSKGDPAVVWLRSPVAQAWAVVW